MFLRSAACHFTIGMLHEIQCAGQDTEFIFVSKYSYVKNTWAKIRSFIMTSMQTLKQEAHAIKYVENITTNLFNKLN